MTQNTKVFSDPYFGKSLADAGIKESLIAKWVRPKDMAQSIYEMKYHAAYGKEVKT